MSRFKSAVAGVVRPRFEGPADLLAQQHREEVAAFTRTVAVREAEIQHLNGRIDALRMAHRADRMRVAEAIELLETCSVSANTRAIVLRTLKALP